MAFGKTSRDPFSTHVGHLIEQCTVGTAHSEDWGQFMNICDFINTTEEGPRDSVKALKRRLLKNYNHIEVRLALSLLDMCMQNCCATFRGLVVKKDFCKVLVKLLNPKYNLPTVMQNKILRFIMTWSNGLDGTSVDVSDVRDAYLDLLKKGIVFPSPETNGETTSEERVNSSHTSKPPMTSSTTGSCSAAPPPPASTISLAPEQIGKLYSELDMVKSNVNVMSAILLENAPDTNNHQDLDLLQTLNTTCRSMQERILELLATVQNEDVTAELIQVNDDLNNAFLRYERFSRSRIRLSENPGGRADFTEVDDQAPSAPASDLIDLAPVSRDPDFSAAGGKVLPTGGLENSSDLSSAHHYANLMPTDATEPNTAKPLLYPELSLLMLEDNSAAPFTTRTQFEGRSLPQPAIYDNGFSPLLPATQLPPVHGTPDPFSAPLEAESTSQVLPTSTAGSMKESSTPPSYYELIEFDPLADTNGTDAVYEDIDKYLFKPRVAQNTEC